MLAICMGCGEGRLPDSVLWMQEGGGALSATTTGEVFVSSRSRGLYKLSGKSGALLWEVPPSNYTIVDIKTMESGDVLTMRKLEESLLLVLNSGNRGESLWSQSITGPLAAMQEYEYGGNRVDTLGDLVVFGGFDRTYLFDSEGTLRWDAPLANGRTSAGATALLSEAGDVVRWEVIGPRENFRYVLQAYDGIDGSPTWSVETQGGTDTNDWLGRFLRVGLIRSRDLIVATFRFRGSVQLGEYTLGQSTPYRVDTLGVFATEGEGAVLWARELPVSSSRMALGQEGEILIAGNSFHSSEIDGHDLGENNGALVSLDTSSGTTNSVLSFLTSIKALASDQVGLYYVWLSPSFGSELLVGLGQ